MDQIFAIETFENAKKLGVSQRAKPLQPLVAKKAFRQSAEERKDAVKKDELI